MANKEKNKATDQVSVSAKHSATKPECPLCHSVNTISLHRDTHSKIDREYRRCAGCDLIFVPKQFHLTKDQEKAVYDCHENNPNDSAYRKFLSKLATPLVKKLDENAKGLDFGCGPGPTLSVMLREAGFSVAEFDPFYAPYKELLTTKYDFITSTEVVEHLSKPGVVFEQLFALLKPRGILGIMTKRPPEKGIEGWHYTKDPTHITFYSELTFQFVANKYDCNLDIISNDTVILSKNA